VKRLNVVVRNKGKDMLTEIGLDKAIKKIMRFAASAVFIKASDSSRRQSVVSGKIGVLWKRYK
jgi:hypothetical protein